MVSFSCNNNAEMPDLPETFYPQDINIEATYDEFYYNITTNKDNGLFVVTVINTDVENFIPYQIAGVVKGINEDNTYIIKRFQTIPTFVYLKISNGTYTMRNLTIGQVDLEELEWEESDYEVNIPEPSMTDDLSKECSGYLVTVSPDNLNYKGEDFEVRHMWKNYYMISPEEMDLYEVIMKVEDFFPDDYFTIGVGSNPSWVIDGALWKPFESLESLSGCN